jgi:hypothetical protein
METETSSVGVRVAALNLWRWRGPSVGVRLREFFADHGWVGLSGR